MPVDRVPHGTTFLTPPPSGEIAVPFAEQVERARAALPADFPTDLTQVLIGLDIDGTIITRDGASEQVKAAYHDLVDAGAHVVIATGRGRMATAPVLAALGDPRGLAACSNGTVMVEWGPGLGEGGRVLRAHTFSASPAIELARQAIPGVRLGVEVAEGFVVNALFPPGELIENHWVVPVDDLRGRKASKIIVRAPHLDLEEFAATLEDSGLRDEHEVFVGWTSWADVGPKGVTKASALAELAEFFGVPHCGTVAVGDGSNDASMIEWAALGVAMGGGDVDVKARADFVTGAVENDGSAAVMRAILER